MTARGAHHRSRRSGAAPITVVVWVLCACAALLPFAWGCSDRSDVGGGPPSVAEGNQWPMYGGTLERRFYNPDETDITRETVGRLIPRWHFAAGAIVTASPIVADIDLAGEPGVRAVFTPSWDGNLYALRARTGEPIWTFTFKPHPGASYPAVSSAAVADIGGRRRLYIGGGMTLYCLDAASGALLWEFDAGTGCTDCDSATERNEIESSPAVFEGVVYFGMDINDTGPAKGGFFAVDAESGVLRWYFDLETGATCEPNAGDDVRRFDGYHSAVELGLPADFFATRRGCDFDRRGTTCGNVWSSPTIDVARHTLYTASSNCDTDNEPSTPEPPPPMPPYDAAIFALDLDTGRPEWVWRPREIDNDDLGIGAVPNLFEIDFGGARREVVGIGVKDGTYYVLDRAGTNQVTGRVEPYWSTKVVEGGDFGGIIASCSVGEDKVLFSTAIGTDISNPQLPAAWTLDANDGSVLWSNPDADPSYSPTTAVPGVVFMGSLGGALNAYDTDTGERLVRLRTLGGPLAAPAVVVDGTVFTGGGVGERGGNPLRPAYITSFIPGAISAFCIAGTEDCPESGACNDGNPCTVDDGTSAATCSSEPAADGTSCALGTMSGECQAGNCTVAASECPYQGQCVQTVSATVGCRAESRPDGTACTARDRPGACQRGTCVVE